MIPFKKINKFHYKWQHHTNYFNSYNGNTVIHRALLIFENPALRYLGEDKKSPASVQRSYSLYKDGGWMGTVVQGVDLFDAGEKDYRPVGQPTLTFEIELAGIEIWNLILWTVIISMFVSIQSIIVTIPRLKINLYFLFLFF